MSETTTRQQLQQMIDGAVSRHNYSELVKKIYESFSSIDTAHDLLREMETEIESGSGQDDPELLEKTGIFSYAQGEFEDAARFLKPVADRTEASHFYGRVLAKLHYFEKALEALENGRLDDNDFETDRFIVEVLCVLRDEERAEKICSRYEESHSDSPDWLYCRGRVSETAGRYGDAVDSYEQAIEKEDEHANSLFRLAYNCDLNGEDDRALELYKKCASLQPTSLGALMNLGVLYEDREEYEQAIECYEKVLAADPAHQRARMYLKDADASLHMAVDEDMGLVLSERDRAQEKPIDKFNLSSRCMHVLDNLDVRTLGDLTRLTESELMSCNNFGEASLQEIKDLLAEYGESLKKEPARLEEKNNSS